jgi:hypothetical protein
VQVQQIKLFHKRIMYGSDSGYVGLANTVDGKNVFGEQVRHAHGAAPPLCRP